MAKTEGSQQAEEDASLFKSRLAYHLRCLAEAATDPDMSSVERLAVVRGRAKKIREIRHMLTAAAESPRKATRRHP
jgi:hypothetical protein